MSETAPKKPPLRPSWLPGIIDRYLLLQFIQNLVICYVCMTGMYIVFDLFTNFDDFLVYGEKHGGVLQVIAEYYGYKAVYFFDRTSGILALIAAMFTMTWIQRHNELTAIMAAGVSRGRVTFPVVLASMFVALLAAANRELGIPSMRDGLSKNAKDLAGDNATEVKPRYDNESDILLRGKEAFGNEQRISVPSFLLPPDMARFSKQIVADNAFYLKANEKHPNGYLLRGVQRPKNLMEAPSVVRHNKRVIVTPRDEPGWLKPNECFVVSDVDYEQLTGGTGWRQFSSTLSLIRGLSNRSLDFGADVRVAIHSRFVQPLLDVTLLFLGLPLVISKGNRNVFLAVGICLVVVVVFMLVTLGSQFLGSNVLVDPALAVWLPLFIFAPAAMAFADPLLE
ncbi:MAG: LptF/LptG family permease [Pirellulales bacterium]